MCKQWKGCLLLRDRFAETTCHIMTRHSFVDMLSMIMILSNMFFPSALLRGSILRKGHGEIALCVDNPSKDMRIPSKGMSNPLNGLHIIPRKG